MKRKIQQSKRARKERKLFRMLLHIGATVDTRQLCSEALAQDFRPKDRYHCDDIEHNIQMNRVIERMTA